MIDAHRALAADRGTERADALAAVRARITAAEARRRRLLDAYEAGAISIADLAERRTALDVQLGAARGELAALEAAADTGAHAERALAALERAVRDGGAAVDLLALLRAAGGACSRVGAPSAGMRWSSRGSMSTPP